MRLPGAATVAALDPVVASVNMSLTIIVATDRARGIGIENRLPWRLPEDLAHFKRVTTGHPIIMGRKTFESIGRPLPGRRNIVITRDPAWRHAGVETVHSPQAAIALLAPAHIGESGSTAAPAAASTSAPGKAATEAFLIGGAEIFLQALHLCSRLIVTEIDKVFECDVFFPEIDAAQWQETAREAYYSEQNGYAYAFVTYQRRTDSHHQE